MHVESENYNFLMYTLNAGVGQDEILLIGQKTVLAENLFVLQKQRSVWHTYKVQTISDQHPI